MQGQSSAIGSLTGSSSSDQGSTPSEQEIDQHRMLQSSDHVDGSDGGPSSLMEGPRLSRKRIATEENVGQSSGSESSNFFQHAESSVWRAIPAPCDNGNSLTIPATLENIAEVNQPEQVNPRRELGVGAATPEHPIIRGTSRRKRGRPSRFISSVQSTDDLNVTSGNNGVSGNVASSSLGGSEGANHQGSGHNWFADRNSSPYPESFSDLGRRLFASSSGLDSGGQNINISPHHPDRHVDRASEGRSRPVTEIPDVLDLMRRGEGFRFESFFFGMGDHHDRHRDMRLDVDNMSYEELLALEDRIGNVSTGVSEETVSSHLKQRKYIVSAKTDLQEHEPCCICQDEYTAGDGLGELECGHCFHAECIKQWLTHKNLCPICKTTAMDGKAEKAES